MDSHLIDLIQKETDLIGFDDFCLFRPNFYLDVYFFEDWIQRWVNETFREGEAPNVAPLVDVPRLSHLVGSERSIFLFFCCPLSSSLFHFDVFSHFIGS